MRYLEILCINETTEEYKNLLDEGIVKLAYDIYKILSIKFQYVRHIPESNLPGNKVIVAARENWQSKAQLNPTRDEIEALAKQSQIITDSNSYLTRRVSKGPAQGTMGPEAAEQAIKDASKEIRQIIKNMETQ